VHNVTLDPGGGRRHSSGRRKVPRLVAEHRVTVSQAVVLCLSGLLRYQERGLVD